MLDLEPIEKRLREATPGPWFVDSCEVCCGVSAGTSWRDRGTTLCEDITRADAAFIAAAPTDIAALIAEVKRLREDRDKLRASLQHAVDDAIVNDDADQRAIEKLAKQAKALRSACEAGLIVLTIDGRESCGAVKQMRKAMEEQP